MNDTISSNEKPHTLIYLKLIAVTLFWGGTFVAGRLISGEVPHIFIAWGRFIIACFFLYFLAKRMEGGLPKLTRSQFHATFALGATGVFLYNLSFLAALEQMPAGRSALFVAFNPIITALAMALIFRERLGWRKWAGIAVAFVGAAVVISRGDLLSMINDISSSVGMGELLMFIAVCAWAAYTILGKHALKGMSPIAATTYASIWGLLLLTLAAVLEMPNLDHSKMTGTVWAAIFYLGFFGTVLGFVWYYEGVNTIGPARTAVFNNLVPVFGVSLAALVLNEPILISMIIGGCIVIAGVYLTNASPKN
jgi:drug/metabolite transporter (DMT)-like permease